MDQQITTNLIINIASDLFLVFIVWALTTSIKAWMNTVVEEKIKTLTEKIESLTKIANYNKASHENLNIKMHDMKKTMNKNEGKWRHVVMKYSELKCVKGGHCENID